MGLRVRLAEKHRAKAELTPEVEAVKCEVARLSQRLTSNPTLAESVQVRSADAARMVDVRSATWMARSVLVHLIRGMRCISNRVADDWAEIDKAEWRKSQILSMSMTSGRRRWRIPSRSHPLSLRRNARRVVTRHVAERQRRRKSRERRRMDRGHVVKTVTRLSP